MVSNLCLYQCPFSRYYSTGEHLERIKCAVSVAVVLLNMCRQNTIIAKVETHRKGIMGALASYVFRLGVSEFQCDPEATGLSRVSRLKKGGR